MEQEGAQIDQPHSRGNHNHPEGDFARGSKNYFRFQCRAARMRIENQRCGVCRQINRQSRQAFKKDQVKKALMIFVCLFVGCKISFWMIVVASAAVWLPVYLCPLVPSDDANSLHETLLPASTPNCGPT